MRVAVRILVIAGVLVTLVVASGFFLLATETGSALTVRLMRPLLPAGIEPGRFSGTLAGSMSVSDASFANDRATVSIGTMYIDWHPSSLFSRTIMVSSLKADSIRIVVRPAGENAPTDPWKPADITLPVSLRIDDLAVSDLSVLVEGGDAKPLQIDTLNLAGGYGADGARLDRLEVVGPAMRIAGTARLDPTGDWPLALDADAAISLPDRPPLELSVVLGGTVDALAVSVDAAAPWDIEITGDVLALTSEPEIALNLQAHDVSVATVAPGAVAIVIDGKVELAGLLDALAISADVTLRPPDFPPVTVRGNAIGSMQRLDVGTMQVRSGKTVLDAAGQIELDGVRPSVDLRGKWTDLVLPPNGAESPFESPRGNFSVKGGPSRYTVDVDAALGAAQGAGALRIAGNVDLDSATPSFSLQGDWSGLTVPVGGDLVVKSQTGKFGVDGTVDAWRFDTRVDVDAGPYSRGTASAAGTGDRNGATVDRLEVPLLAGLLTGRAEVTWLDGAGIEATLSARDLDPSRVTPELAGQVGFTAGVSARSAASGLTARLNLSKLNGRLHDSRLGGDAVLQLADNTVVVERLALRVGNARLDASGRIGAASDLRWNLDAEDLSVLSPNFSGRLMSDGRWQGNVDSFELDASIEGRDTVIAGYFSIGQVDGTVHAARGAERDLEITLNAADLSLRGERVEAVKVSVSGRVGQHVGEAAISSARGAVTLRAAGGYRDGTWDGTIEELAATPGTTGQPWTLRQPGPVTIGRGLVQLERACLARAEASICANANWQPSSPASAQLSIDDLPLADFAAMLPPGLDYSGSMTGELNVAATGEIVTGDAELALTAGHIVPAEPTDESQTELLAWRSASATAQLSENRLRISAGFDLTEDGSLQMRGTVPMKGLAPDRTAALDASLEASLQRFALLEALVPDLAAVRGAVNIDATVTGSLAAPRFNGSAVLSDGSADLPRLGLQVGGMQLAIRGDGSNITLDGKAQSGDGNVAFDGKFALADGSWRGDATLTGEKFTAVSLPELTATVSPDLAVNVDARTLRLTGKLVVPSARIEPRDLAGTVQASPDAVIVGGKMADTTGEAWEVFSNVDISLGKAVTIDAFGLTGRIAGRIVARDEPGRQTVASGELKVVDATYEAYGQKLTVERGRLIFTGGPIASPGLDIRATRSIDDVTVGVDLRGQLNQPETTLFSRPSLGQADTLSYLVLGRPVSTVGSNDQDVLNRASVGLGLSGAELLAQQVGRRLGLDEVSIDNGADQSEAALVVGKYLSPKLYVSYGLGLFEAFNRALLRYQITPNFSLQTEAGIEQSADIVYTLER